MKLLLLIPVLLLGACAHREPPFSCTTITHYGYSNPNHVRLSAGYASPPAQYPCAPMPYYPQPQPYFSPAARMFQP